MHFQKYSVLSVRVLILISVNFEPGSCIFNSLRVFSNTKQNVSFPETFLKRQSPTFDISSTIDITSSNTLPTMQFGDECETNGRSCAENAFLECIDGKCMCKNPMSHVFDDQDQLQKCVGLSGSQCGSGKPTCIKNAQCVFGSCQCLENYGETSSKVCMLNHRQPCGSGECNAGKGLACMKGYCQCIDSVLVFDPFSKKCVNPQMEFDKFSKTVGRDVVQRMIARTVSDATSLVFLPFRLLIPGIG